MIKDPDMKKIRKASIVNFSEITESFLEGGSPCKVYSSDEEDIEEEKSAIKRKLKQFRILSRNVF